VPPRAKLRKNHSRNGSLREYTDSKTIRVTSLGPVSTLLPIKIYGNDSYMAYHRRPLALDTLRARYPSSFPAGTFTLKNGTVRRDGAKVLMCDIVVERDVEVILRDGTKMYTNIFRPTGDGKYPVIFGWSPYGKEFGGQWQVLCMHPL
jgi:predicted acyl esterase